jgi:mannose-6-phosphate isomerase-like protein (cupin superfamily)
MDDATGAYLYQPGEGELRWMGETSTFFLATGDGTGGAFCLVDEQASRGESVPLHRHPEDMESFYVLEGVMTLFVGDQPGVRAAAGAFAYLPGGTIHGFRVESERRATSSSRHRATGSSTARSPSPHDRATCRRSTRFRGPRSSRRARNMASSSSDHCPTQSVSRGQGRPAASGPAVLSRARRCRSRPRSCRPARARTSARGVLGRSPRCLSRSGRL